MPNTTFPNIDFGFRRGSKAGLDASAIANGTFNVCKDTRQLFIDIDNQRIEITDFISDYTEDEIFNLESPLDKLYLSTDTFIPYYYDQINMEWKSIGISKEYIDSKISDMDCGDEG